jgi:cytochrome P450
VVGEGLLPQRPGRVRLVGGAGSRPGRFLSDAELAAPGFAADPYPTYGRWRRDSPVWWSDRLDAYVISRYADVRLLLTRPEHFAQSRRYEGAMIDAFGRDTLVILEGSRHAEVRAPVADYFRPRRLARALGGAIAANADRIVAGLAETFELTRDVSEALVMDSMALLFGVDDTRLLEELYGPLIVYLKRSRALAADDAVKREGQAAGARLVEFLRELTRLRAARPGEDLVSHLLQAGMPGEEVETVCALTLIGGVDTTVRGLANTLLGVLSTAGELERLRAEPARLENAFDEGLRWLSPLQLKGREVRSAIRLHGLELEPGRAAIGLLGSANRDPQRYPDPDRFDSARRTGDHLAFGFGAHYCVGAPLARLEAAAMLRALLRRFGELAAPPAGELSYEGPVYRSPLELPLRGVSARRRARSASAPQPSP